MSDSQFFDDAGRMLNSDIAFGDMLDEAIDGDEKLIIANAFLVNDEWQRLLDGRQAKELNFAIGYVSEFAHGTAGHNRLMLIARIADILDIYERVVNRLLAKPL